jgi:ATP-binding protein involved in chromosome partitioning
MKLKSRSILEFIFLNQLLFFFIMLKIFQENKLSSIKHIIGIAAGKGGVGKSTITVQLALSLKKLGYGVGILDGDLYGPSLNTLLPAEVPPKKGTHKLIPATSLGIKMMTLDYFGSETGLAAWRAPIANRFVSQFFSEVDWGPLDFLLIDFPPGIGDIPMTLSQQGKLNGAIAVTTPQAVALQDVIKAVKLFERLKIPLLGVIENMSYLDLPDGNRIHPFGKDGGKDLASTLSVPLFGTIPLDPAISKECDEGFKTLTPHPAFDVIVENILISLNKRVVSVC